jgi:hypothetical protein
MGASRRGMYTISTLRRVLSTAYRTRLGRGLGVLGVPSQALSFFADWKHYKHERPHAVKHEASQKNPGGDLLSHPVAQAVSSALEGLTSVFGMGTGVSPPP